MNAARLHEWFEYRGLTCCRVCGLLMRHDGLNKPCKGRPYVGPRQIPQSTNAAGAATYPQAPPAVSVTISDLNCNKPERGDENEK